MIEPVKMLLIGSSVNGLVRLCIDAHLYVRASSACNHADVGTTENGTLSGVHFISTGSKGVCSRDNGVRSAHINPYFRSWRVSKSDDVFVRSRSRHSDVSFDVSS